MYRLQVKSHFDSAHWIKDYKGQCSRVHGHRWEIEVCIGRATLDSMNMAVDFKVVKVAMDNLIRIVDHVILNDVFDENNLTAEYLVKWFYDRLSISLTLEGVKVERVCIWESPDCCVKYYGG